MDFINIIGTLFDNSINHIVALAYQIKDLRLNKNQQDINEDIYNKLDQLDNKQNSLKGYFSSFDTLISLYPSPEIGEWAIVSVNGHQLICKCESAGEWTITQEEYSEEINLEEYVKQNNLKTINNESIIGTGNIEIKGGTSSIVDSETDGIMPKELYNDIIKIKNITLPELSENIESLQSLIGTDSEELERILNQYNTIVEFIEGFDDSSEALSQILSSIQDLKDKILQETNRAKDEEQLLLAKLRTLENRFSERDNVKHIFITQSNYNELTTYENNTIYFIVDEDIVGYRFGDKFPMVFCSPYLGDKLPIILSEEPGGQKFGEPFPIQFIL